ncbi:unnamed protein product [Prunus armeniaca]|uniref:Uncharacterized protein n=1 Tax=Prunus armeniaca TaxID=36596 RepID=A0A6J5V342_PRUAR|nr:unnamed protein product [Prunus armeniaca]
MRRRRLSKNPIKKNTRSTLLPRAAGPLLCLPRAAGSHRRLRFFIFLRLRAAAPYRNRILGVAEKYRTVKLSERDAFV